MQVYDVSSVEELCQQMNATDYYFLNAREKFLSRYQAREGGQQQPQGGDDDDDDEGLVCGRGESFPDDRTERLDVASLILQHPSNLAGELKFHKELFSKLKFNYLEQESKERFLKRILEVPAYFGEAADVEAMEQSNAQLKAEMKRKKASIVELKEHLIACSTNVCQAHEALLAQQARATALVQEVRGLEEEYERLEEYVDPHAAALREEAAHIAADTEHIRALTEQLEAAKAELYARQAVSVAVQQEVEALAPQRQQADAFAQEAMRISQLKDPQVEELGRWYEEMNALLYGLSDIKRIRNKTAMELEVEYAFGGAADADTNSICCALQITLTPQASSFQARVLCNGQEWMPVTGLLAHLLTHGSGLKLDERLALAIRLIYQHLLAQHEWEAELATLDPEVVSATPEAAGAEAGSARQVMLTLAERVAVVEVDALYPVVPAGLRVVGLEPLGPQGSAELDHWNAVIARDGLSLSQLIQRLE